MANAVVAVLSNPTVSANKYVYVSSFETNQNQLLQVVENISGEKWTVKHVRSVDKVSQAEAAIADGAEGMAWLMAQGTLAASALFGGDDYQADFVKFGRSSNGALGLKQREIVPTVAGFLQS